MHQDICLVVAKFVMKHGRNIPGWKNNEPGLDLINLEEANFDFVHNSALCQSCPQSGVTSTPKKNKQKKKVKGGGCGQNNFFNEWNQGFNCYNGIGAKVLKRIVSFSEQQICQKTCQSNPVLRYPKLSLLGSILFL